MNNILNIAKKEIVDIVRDKRTLRAMLLIPLVIFPLFFIVVNKITNSQSQKDRNKHLKVGIINNDNAQVLTNLLENESKIELIYYEDSIQLDSLVKGDYISAGLMIESDFDRKQDLIEPGHISIIYKSSDQFVEERLVSVINCYKRYLIHNWLGDLKVNKSEIEPLIIDKNDLLTDREKIGRSIGGFLTYILIIFSFLGCTHPAIQFFSNEKEHGTLETLLIAPITKYELLFGKMIGIVVIGLLSSIASIVGIGIGIFYFAQSLPPEVVERILSMIQPSSIIMLIGMLLPLISFFAGILTLITNYANSYKEAQSIISPLTPLIALPAIIGLIPGIKLNYITAAIPITNIALATKEIIAGSISLSLFAMVLFYLLAYAIIVVLLSVKLIDNELYLSKK